eukprot:233955-Alexandrium_andersonii.AAC.1
MTASAPTCGFHARAPPCAHRHSQAAPCADTVCSTDCTAASVLAGYTHAQLARGLPRACLGSF